MIQLTELPTTISPESAPLIACDLIPRQSMTKADPAARSTPRKSVPKGEARSMIKIMPAQQFEVQINQQARLKAISSTSPRRLKPSPSCHKSEPRQFLSFHFNIDKQQDHLIQRETFAVLTTGTDDPESLLRPSRSCCGHLRRQLATTRQSTSGNPSAGDLRGVNDRRPAGRPSR